MPEYKPYYGHEAEKFYFYAIPKALIKEEPFKSSLSYGSRILYALLHNRMELSMRNNWLDDDGKVFINYSIKEIQEDLGCSNKTATKFLAELTEIGLISRKRIRQGKCDKIYVNKFYDDTDNKSQTCKNYTSKNEEVTHLNVNKVHTNYKDNNNTDNSDTNSFFLRLQENEDTVCPAVRKNEEVQAQSHFVNKEAWKKRLKYDYHQQFADAGIYNALFDRLIEILSTHHNTVLIHGKAESKTYVIDKLLNITESDIDYATICVNRFNKQIRNPKAFYATVLFDCVGNGDAGIMNLAKADWG